MRVLSVKATCSALILLSCALNFAHRAIHHLQSHSKHVSEVLLHVLSLHRVNALSDLSFDIHALLRVVLAPLIVDNLS